MKCVQHEWLDITGFDNLSKGRCIYMCSTCGAEQLVPTRYAVQNKAETKGENRCFAPTLAEKPTS